MSLANRIALGLLPWIDDEIFTKIQYLYKQRRWLNLDLPQTFNEKIQWLKLRHHDPRLTNLVDKYAVRDFVHERIGEEYLIPLVGVYEHADDIPFDQLPARFVIKATHGSGWTLLCFDRNHYDWEQAKKRIAHWLSSNFFRVGREWAYRDVPPRVVCEEMIDDGSGQPPPDYKIFCFHGEPRLIQVDLNRFSGHRRNLYDTQWNLLPTEFEYPVGDPELAAPPNLGKMLNVAKLLSASFPFVRVDLYSTPRGVYFGEMTFFPEKGVGRFRPYRFDEEFGRHLDLGCCQKSR